ncbi:hypothetical protein BC826DRAFT_636595 [Russula brevipes]|nr:hypothetical protein BC826DRAFT_636595 [Russula brevipes]
MLRRATTGHRPCLVHNQLRSRPLLLPSPHRQNPFTQRSFSPALALCENEPRPDNFQDHPPPTAQSPGPVADDAPKKEDSLDHAPSDTTQENAGPAQASRERPRTTRLRALRPLLLPPTFPLSLLPVTPVFEPPPSKKRDEAAETNASTTIALAGLPPNTLKTDIRPVFQRFGEVKHMIVHPGGSSADVLFADVHGLRRTLHAYADEPIRVRGQEITVFRKHAREAGLSLGAHSVAAENAVLRDKSTSHSFAEQGESDGAIFVTDFPLDTTQEELSEALGSLGKYERFVMRPDSKYAYFVYQNDDPVKHILSVHRRVPITIRGQTLRIERTPHRPYILSPGPSGHPIEFGKLLDPATSSMIADELKRTVPGWKGSC